MYLNIVNNLSFDNKRKRFVSKKKEKENQYEELPVSEDFNNTYEIVYNSVFYGQLTQNWLKFKN